MAQQFLNIAGTAGNLVPGLEVLVGVVDAIHNSAKAVKRNRLQCMKLADYCADVVNVLTVNLGEVDAMEPSPTRERLKQRNQAAIEKMQKCVLGVLREQAAAMVNLPMI